MLSTGADSAVLLLVLHRIAADGWSVEPLLRDLAAAYTARRAGTGPAWQPLPVQYGDYALWQREFLGDPGDAASVAGRQLAFWADYLRGAPEELQFPIDRPRPHIPSFRGGFAAIDVDKGLHTRLAELALAAGTTVTMVLQAAVAVLLTRLGAGTDLPIGVATAGRNDEATHPLIGFFVNTLVVRIDTSGNPAFAELLRRVRAASLAAYDHQDVPFEQLVEMFSPRRSASRHPLTQVMIGTQPAAPADIAFPGLAVEARPVRNMTAKFDLAFRFEERRGDDGEPQGVTVSLEYSGDLFDHNSAEWNVGRVPLEY